MAIGIATGFLILLVIYFIWQTAQNQDLELEYSLYYSPRETVVETQLNVGAPPNEIWDVLTDLADYHHWFPWIRRVHVTNPGADRWVHRHSIDHFPVEVGTRFKIRPFLFSPLTGCRFITVDPPNILSMEMRLFPLNREFVSFSLKPFKRHVEVTYRATRRGPLGFLTTTMFSWRGKYVLRNLAQRLPEITFVPEEEKPVVQEAPATIDQAFIDALVAKALSEGDDILTRIGDRPTRAMAKSAYIKAKRAGKAPEATKEATQVVERFLVGEQTPAAAKEEPAEKKTPEPAESRESASSEDAIVDEAVKQALAGNTDLINAISDRVIRAKAKSAYVRAKRQAT